MLFLSNYFGTFINQIKSTLFEKINIIKLCTGLESEKNSFELTVSCFALTKTAADFQKQLNLSFFFGKE